SPRAEIRARRLEDSCMVAPNEDIVRFTQLPCQISGTDTQGARMVKRPLRRLRGEAHHRTRQALRKRTLLTRVVGGPRPLPCTAIISMPYATLKASRPRHPGTMPSSQMATARVPASTAK